MSKQLYDALGTADGVTTGKQTSRERWYAHIDNDSIARALAIIDTRHRGDIDIKRLEPSGNPGNDDMFVSWEELDDE